MFNVFFFILSLQRRNKRQSLMSFWCARKDGRRRILRRHSRVSLSWTSVRDVKHNEKSYTIYVLKIDNIIPKNNYSRKSVLLLLLSDLRFRFL